MKARGVQTAARRTGLVLLAGTIAVSVFAATSNCPQCTYIEGEIHCGESYSDPDCKGAVKLTVIPENVRRCEGTGSQFHCWQDQQTHVFVWYVQGAVEPYLSTCKSSGACNWSAPVGSSEYYNPCWHDDTDCTL
jgi:hypothetical protein